MVDLELCMKLGLELRLYDPTAGECLRNHCERELRFQKQLAAKQAAESEFLRLRAQLWDLQPQR